MGFLSKYWHKYGGLFTVGVLCVLMEAMCDLMQPRIMSQLIDDGVMQGSLADVKRYGLQMLLVAGVGVCFALSRNYIASHVSQRFAAELRHDLFTKIHSLSSYGIDSFESGSLITRETNDVTQIQNFANGLMRVIAKAPFVCIGAIVMAATLNLRTLPILVPIVAAVAIGITACMRLAYPRFGKVQNALDRLNTSVREYLVGIRLVKAFRRFRDEETRFNRANDGLVESTIEANRVIAVLSPLTALFVHMGIAAILWFGSRWVEYGDMQVGQVMAFVSYMTNIMASLNIISMTMNMFVRVRSSHRRIAEVFDAERDGSAGGGTGDAAAGGAGDAAFSPSQVELSHDSTLTAEARGVGSDICSVEGSGVTHHDAPHIRLDNLGFQYRGSTGQPALRNISFALEKGETLGIIGPTGSGKTTLASLLLRFYEPTEGGIFINGVPLGGINEGEWRSRIAIVPQSPALFAGTIRDNILWGKKDATDEEIERAALDAQAYGFITATGSGAKPQEGFLRQIGQEGTGLSGGQKQRVSIARALVRSPELLVLDDCTSALDVVTEAAVKDALSHYSMTTVLITQRVATVRGCSKILILENGAMAGFGTHEELTESCTVYNDIIRSQLGDAIHDSDKGGSVIG